MFSVIMIILAISVNILIASDWELVGEAPGIKVYVDKANTKKVNDEFTTIVKLVPSLNHQMYRELTSKFKKFRYMTSINGFDCDNTYEYTNYFNTFYDKNDNKIKTFSQQSFNQAPEGSPMNAVINYYCK